MTAAEQVREHAKTVEGVIDKLEDIYEQARTRRNADTQHACYLAIQGANVALGRIETAARELEAAGL